MVHWLIPSLTIQGVLRPGLPGAMLAAGADARSPLYRAIVRIQSRYRGYVVRKVLAVGSGLGSGSGPPLTRRNLSGRDTESPHSTAQQPRVKGCDCWVCLPS